MCSPDRVPSSALLGCCSDPLKNRTAGPWITRSRAPFPMSRTMWDKRLPPCVLGGVLGGVPPQYTAKCHAVTKPRDKHKHPIYRGGVTLPRPDPTRITTRYARSYPPNSRGPPRGSLCSNTTAAIPLNASRTQARTPTTDRARTTRTTGHHDTSNTHRPGGTITPWPAPATPTNNTAAPGQPKSPPTAAGPADDAANPSTQATPTTSDTPPTQHPADPPTTTD